MKNFTNIPLENKKVLLRVDVNAALKDGRVLDSPRFKEAAETIKFLLSKKAKVIILAHQGRRGSKDYLESLEQHAQLLSKHVSKKIKYVDDLFGTKVNDIISDLKSGEALLLKNVRAFDYESYVENQGNQYYEFSKQFDIFVNDAFSVCHRAQGSIMIPPRVIPGYAGPNLEKEIVALNNFKAKGKSVYLIGGAKVDDCLPMFHVLENKEAVMLISGVLANLMLMADGGNLGYENKWVRENGFEKLLPKLKELHKKYEYQIILPVDFAVGSPDGKSKRKEVTDLDFPLEKKVWDVGHDTVDDFKSAMKGAKTIFMKGPLGFSEMKEYSYATLEILKEIAKLTKKGAFSLLGGGNLTTAIQEYKIPNNFSYVSTSGGALIAYISGEKLPGLEALENSI